MKREEHSVEIENSAKSTKHFYETKPEKINETEIKKQQNHVSSFAFWLMFRQKYSLLNQKVGVAKLKDFCNTLSEMFEM